MKTVDSQTTPKSTNTSIPLRNGSEKSDFFSARSGSSIPFFGPSSVQPKLNIGQPGDKYEHQADRVADTVMRMPDSQIQRQPIEEEEEELQMKREETLIQRKCEECEEEEKLQKKSDGKSTSADRASNINSQLASKSGTGNRLPKMVRSEMAHKMGVDFSGVNIHTGPAAHKLNRQLGARAFTHGSDIYFNEGEYSPTSNSGKHLLAHELTHVVQQGGINDKSGGNFKNHIIQKSPPDISYQGYYTFYLEDISNKGKEDGFVAQFTMIDDATNTASVKFLYQQTQHLKEFQFRMPSNDNLNPDLISQDGNLAVFDLNGDGQPDLEILLLSDTDIEGIRVYITQPGQTVGTYIIPPPRRRIVPNRGYPMGTLPNGKRYYLQPWTYHLPGGPRYVDEDGRGVNPGLEFQAAATLDTMMKGYLYTYGAIAAITLGSVAVAELSASALITSSVARGAGAVRWLFSGTRLVAGGTGAAANLATQALEHGTEWDRYNWGSVGFDYVMGAVSYSVAKAVVTRWPAPLFSSQIGNLKTWVNFGKQQSVLALYGTLVGAVRALVSNTSTGSTIGAQHTEGVLQMVKSVGLQTFLASAKGKQMFPAGFNDPRIAFISRTLTFLTKLTIREVFDVVPQSSQGEAETESDQE